MSAKDHEGECKGKEHVSIKEIELGLEPLLPNAPTQLGLDYSRLDKGDASEKDETTLPLERMV